MAESAQYRSLLAELNKLNKSQLIEIIIKKTVPEGLSISEELHKCIHSSPDSFGKKMSEVDGVQEPSYKEISNSLQRELNVSGKLIQQLEERVNDQKLIISLLKKESPIDKHPNKNKMHAGIENDSFKTTEYKVNNQDAKKLSVPQKTQPNTTFDRQTSVRSEKSVNRLDDGIWEIPRYEYRRRININRRGNRVYGKATEFEFKGVVKYKDYHVYRLPPKFEDTDLINHLKSKDIQDVKCERMNSRYPDEYSSFKVSVALKYDKEFRNPNIWPEYVVINPFLKKVGQIKRTE